LLCNLTAFLVVSVMRRSGVCLSVCLSVSLSVCPGASDVMTSWRHTNMLTMITSCQCVELGDEWRLLVCVWVGLCVSLCVRALKGKQLELSTLILVHVYCMAVVRHALTRRSKGQRSRSHGYQNRHGCVAPAWVCTSFDCFCFLGIAIIITVLASQ